LFHKKIGAITPIAVGGVSCLLFPEYYSLSNLIKTEWSVRGLRGAGIKDAITPGEILRVTGSLFSNT